MGKFLELPLGIETKVKVVAVEEKDDNAFVLELLNLTGVLMGTKVNCYFARKFRSGSENYKTTSLFRACFGKQCKPSEIHPSQFLGKVFFITRTQSNQGYPRFVEIWAPKEDFNTTPKEFQGNPLPKEYQEPKKVVLPDDNLLEIPF